MNKKLIRTSILVCSVFSLFAFASNKSVNRVNAATDTVKQQVAELMAPATEKYTGSYYNGITAKSGKALRDQLHDLIRGWQTSGNSYEHLYDIYKVSDLRPDGTIWDTYGDFGFSPANKAGTYKKEGDCYNREHSIPASWFSDRSPMYYDAFHLMPTDGYVNNRRSNDPFGEVSGSGKYHYTFNNYVSGTSKSGSSITPGISGTVFEPADCYKGDYARNYFYFITCYYQDSIYESAGSAYFKSSTKDTEKQFGLTTAARDLLIKWHTQDPVSQKEVERCDGVYSFQKNRNPFIDHPEFVDAIWGDGQVDIDPGVDAPTLSIYNGTTKLTSDTVTINVGDTITLYGYKNTAKDETITYTVNNNDGVANVTKVEYYYPQITGLKAGSFTITFKLPYSVNGTTKYVTKTITIVVESTGTSGDGGDDTPVSTLSLDDGMLPTQYPGSEATKKVSGFTFGFINVANYGTGMQFKSSGASLYNIDPIPHINSIKFVKYPSKQNATLSIAFANTLSGAKTATGTKLDTNDTITCNNGSSYFCITNSSKAAYAAEIIINYGTSEGGETTPTLVKIEKSGTCKTVYQDGEHFNPAGLTVTATYSDNSTKDITNDVNWNVDVLHTGTTSVVGEYEGKTIIVNVTVNGQVHVTLTKIEKSGTCKTNYVDGESFNPNGLTVTATYSDGSTSDVTNSVTWDKTILHVGDTSVVGTFEQKTVTIDIIVTSSQIDDDDDDNDDLDPVETTFGCGGSILTGSILVTTASLLAIGFTIRKKKEN